MTNKIEFSAAQKLADHAVSRISELVGTDISELQNEIFNSDYWIIGRYQSEQFLIECGGVFHCIGIVQDYEESNFGEVNTKLHESEHVSNMIAYIVGEDILNDSQTLQENFEEELTEELAIQIIAEIKEEYNLA